MYSGHNHVQGMIIKDFHYSYLLFPFPANCYSFLLKSLISLWISHSHGLLTRLIAMLILLQFSVFDTHIFIFIYRCTILTSSFYDLIACSVISHALCFWIMTYHISSNYRNIHPVTQKHRFLSQHKSSNKPVRRTRSSYRGNRPDSLFILFSSLYTLFSIKDHTER